MEAVGGTGPPGKQSVDLKGVGASLAAAGVTLDKECKAKWEEPEQLPRQRVGRMAEEPLHGTPAAHGNTRGHCHAKPVGGRLSTHRTVCTCDGVGAKKAASLEQSAWKPSACSQTGLHTPT